MCISQGLPLHSSTHGSPIGAARQSELIDRAHHNHQMEKEARAQAREMRMHPAQVEAKITGRVSNQHSDEANVDGVRNIN